ncbi:MAG: GntR family transcriptional regulator [Solobacterium sp.]|nr:GntR family transcriptional regulator [Solobacterium sp.]
MFLLNLQSKIPIYEQIQTQILRFIEAGVLKPGDKLPSVRQLVVDNGINPNTAARAYAQLEAAGYVYNLPKKGVYIAEFDTGSSRSAQIVSVIRPLMAAGYTKKELIDVIEKLFTEVE